MIRKGYPYLVGGLIAAVTVIAFLGCTTGKDQLAQDQANAGSQRKPMHFPGPLECPDHDPFKVWVSGDSGTVSQLALPGGTTLIPEFHDCQRLIDDRHEFGPLVGIWVPPYLQTVEKLMMGGQQAVPVAVIHAWDGDFDQLGIKQQWNCLFLYYKDSAIRSFAARMTPVAADSECSKPVPVEQISQKGTVLNVEADTIPGLRPEDYPSVGRWDRERGIPVQFIGLTCGPAWCEIFNPKFPHLSSPSYGPGGSPSQEERRVLEVKGWYDEQPLAVNAGGKLKPLPFRAAIWPEPALDRLVKGDFKGRWILSGHSTVEEPSAEYETKLGIIAGRPPQKAPPGRVTDVEMCWEGPDDGATCRGVPSAVQASCAWDPVKDVGNKWYAQIKVAGNTKKFVCVRRRDHSTVVSGHIPGTARWTWRENDETQWFRCDQACCTLKP